MPSSSIASRDEIVEWLSRTSTQAGKEWLYDRARRVVRRHLGDRGRIWAAIGLDQCHCRMGCAFCSFSSPHRDPVEYRELGFDETLRWANQFIRGGADYLVLRTSEEYPLEKLARLGRAISRDKPAAVRLLANTGLATGAGLDELYDAGFYGIYKTVRLREGIDTVFSTRERLDQIRQARRAGLQPFSLVEPIGPEHSDEEIADAILTLGQEIGSVLIGGMARVPFDGSPLAHFGMIDAERLAAVTAAFVLAMEHCFDKVEVVCSHPAFLEVLHAGANAVVVEIGAIPRDNTFAETEWRGVTITQARDLLRQAGYRN